MLKVGDKVMLTGKIAKVDSSDVPYKVIFDHNNDAYVWVTEKAIAPYAIQPLHNVDELIAALQRFKKKGIVNEKYARRLE